MKIIHRKHERKISFFPFTIRWVTVRRMQGVSISHQDDLSVDNEDEMWELKYAIESISTFSHWITDWKLVSKILDNEDNT